MTELINSTSNVQHSKPYHFGTAGWSYPDWDGPVYPINKPKNFNPLFFLSKNFNFVEVNTTFYHIPALKLTNGWVKKTESIQEFKFWIKVFQNFTHKRILINSEINNFKNSLEPLIRSSQLIGLLAQFPYSFKLSSNNLGYLEELHNNFNEFCFAVEFRHISWNTNEILDYFKKNNIIWVNIDQPLISQSLPATSHLTNPEMSYFRLHGRNYKSWFSNEGRNARYNYDYNAIELNQIAQKIKKLKDITKKIFISGNNHYKGSAIKNLIELKKVLKSQ